MSSLLSSFFSSLTSLASLGSISALLCREDLRGSFSASELLSRLRGLVNDGPEPPEAPDAPEVPEAPEVPTRLG